MDRPGLFRYHRFTIDKSQPLGHGSYGTVYKGKCDQLPCAAKVLHPTILDRRDPGAARIMDRFRQECSFLESIRHPNIVQYLGMSTDPESRLPVLLMELLDESLTKLLERSEQQLAFHIQVDICHDIALAVAYLHSNDIIHRDLSSNNVLMIAGRRAKVTDFGMSKLSRVAPTMTPLTVCPGTQAYMAPEALRESPQYTKGLDCFSEGVMIIQVCTRLWPEPGSRTQIVEDSRYPMGFTEMPIAESERRKNHIDLIDPTHPLLPIAIDCLKYRENERPSSEELCQRLAGLKESSRYVVRDQHDEIQALQRKVEQLTLEYTSRPQVVMKMHWRDGGKAPLKMARGAVVLDGNLVYFMNWIGDTCSYDLTSKKWKMYLTYPYLGSRLAIINSQLTAIGGYGDISDKSTYTNQLLSLHERDGWTSVFPPMPTKRCSTTTAATKEHLIVAGGSIGPRRDEITTVEVMDTRALVWSTVASLPHPCSVGSAVICGDRLYMLGGWDNEGKTKLVLTCSLLELLQSPPCPLSRIWHRVADSPAYRSTCAAVNGELLVVSGCDETHKATPAIHKYTPATNSWYHITNLPTARWQSLVAVLPSSELMVVGGRMERFKDVDNVEIATFDGC